MSKFKLIVSPFAEEDLQISFYWYNRHKVGLGEELLIEIESILNKIEHKPTHFPIYKNKIRIALVHRFPFVIYYYVTSETINVFAIFHSSRNPKKWKIRLQK